MLTRSHAHAARIVNPVIEDAVLTKLEFPEVLRRLSVHCQYSVAADLARELRPTPDRRVAALWVATTAEGVDLLRNFPEFNVGGARDIRELVLRAEKGARLQPPELLLVADTLHAARRLKRTFLKLPDCEERFPNLLELIGSIENVHRLETGLERSIGPRGDVLDTASPELARLRKAVREDGRPARTHYRVRERWRDHSLLELRLETGRTHQIRVHFSALHHPCAGDPTYGGDPVLAKRLGLDRQWLHAVRLGFEHPGTGSFVDFSSDYPDDLQHALDLLRSA